MRRPKTPFKNANAKPTDPNAPEDRTPFLMSMTQLARLIGRDQDTLTSWIKKNDCPVHTLGNGQGEATLLDPRDVFRWRESFCRKEEIAMFQPAANPADPSSGSYQFHGSVFRSPLRRSARRRRRTAPAL